MPDENGDLPLMSTKAICLTSLVFVIVTAQLGAQAMPPELAQFLRTTVQATPDQLSSVTTGRSLVRVLAPSDRREVAVLGVIHIAVPRAFYVRRATDFPTALRDPERLRFAILSDPVAPADVAGLTLSHDDVDDLMHCKPGSCKFKLSAATIEKVRAAITPGSPVADSIATAFFRGRMADYVTAYRARGNRALVVYADEDSTTDAAQVFDSIVSRSPYMYQYAPALERYLINYPDDRPSDIAEALYWSEDNLPGLQRTISITHTVVYAPPEHPETTLIASKLLYADHYLDGALDLTAVVDQSGAADGVYVVVLHRMHFDELPSGGLLNIRGKVIGKLRDQTTAWLNATKTRTEQVYAAAPASR